MEIKVLRADDQLSEVALVGRLDHAGVREIEDRFREQTVARQKPAVIDFSDVSFMASLGIEMLIMAAKSLAEGTARCVILNPQPLVEKILKRAGVEEIMLVTHDRGQAMKWLGLS